AKPAQNPKAQEAVDPDKPAEPRHVLDIDGDGDVDIDDLVAAMEAEVEGEAAEGLIRDHWIIFCPIQI
ncbi:unnamed protein product, partial [Polarella glacialis]